MPTYQYACTACGHRFEAVQSFSDASLTDCPECAGRLRKVFSSVGIVFKGSGFYRTDSRSGAGEKPGDAGKSDAGSSTKDAGKDEGSSTSKEPAAKKPDSSSSGSSSSGSSGSSGSKTTAKAAAAS